MVLTGRLPPVASTVLADHEVWTWDGEGPITSAERDEQLADADAVLTQVTDRVDRAFLDAAPQLAIVANVAVGYNNIDVDACRSRGIVVTNTPDVLTDATADLALGLLLSVTRRMGEGERLIRSGEPWAWGFAMMLGTGIQGRRLGIVGLGAIGAATARRARALGMTIAYHNRRPADARLVTELGAVAMDLDELLATSDVVSLHCPYTPETHHLIDAAALAAMRPTAFLINTARGPIVDESALVAALDAGRLAGAGLDVYEDEPAVHPGLLRHANVALTPHLGSATVETRNAMAELAARNVAAVLAGRPPLTPVS